MTRIVNEAIVLYSAKGRKTHVVLPYERYAELLERLEDAKDLQAMNEAESDEQSIPLKEFRKKVSRNRK